MYVLGDWPVLRCAAPVLNQFLRGASVTTPYWVGMAAYANRWHGRQASADVHTSHDKSPQNDQCSGFTLMIHLWELGNAALVC
jgi:hypothetical protein